MKEINKLKTRSSLICDNCGNEFLLDEASQVYVDSEVYYQCPKCGCINIPR